MCNKLLSFSPFTWLYYIHVSHFVKVEEEGAPFSLIFLFYVDPISKLALTTLTKSQIYPLHY